MKKFLAIILTFAVIASSLGLTACTIATSFAHAFPDEWTFDETHHWKVCIEEDCDYTTKKTEHSFADGVCECGAKKSSSTTGGGKEDGNGTTGGGKEDGNGITGGGTQVSGNPQISKNDWQKAFDFDNVTIRQYLVKEGKQEYNSSYLFDGDKLMLSAPNHESITEDKANIERTKSLYDFSSCFSSASFKDGKYFIDSFSPMEGITHQNVSLTFSDGKLVLVEGTLIGGSGTEEPQNYYTEFYNYGTTVVEKSNDSTNENKPGISVTNPDYTDNSQRPNSGTNPDLNDEPRPEPTEPSKYKVYLDHQEKVYHLEENCGNKNLDPADKNTAEKMNYTPCEDCVK